MDSVVVASKEIHAAKIDTVEKSDVVTEIAVEPIVMKKESVPVEVVVKEVEVRDTVKAVAEPVKVVKATEEPVKEVESASTAIENVITARVEKWRTDWENADIEKYESNYDTQKFQSGDYNWERWRAKKVRTFRNYSTINISITNLKIEKLTKNQAVVVFFQKYQSDLFRAENGKKLILQNRAGNWKIVQEFTVRYKESM